ncbi:MAG: magnesium transporter CorA family protein [Bacilli bacterium]
MIEVYKTNETKEILEKKKTIVADSWINVIDPTPKEIKKLITELKLDNKTVKQVLTEDEISRIDIEENRILTIIDVPIIEKKSRHISFKTFPLGIFIIQDKYILTMCSRELDLLNKFKDNEIKGFFTAKKNRFTLQLLSAIAGEYLKSLRLINEETEKAERLLGKSPENKELLKLLSIDKSLVYLTTSLKSNEVVFQRLLNGNILTIYDEDKDIIEEAIVKNKQAIELSQIYKDILKGLSNSLSTISSNNLNNIMKFLTSVTIIISIPTMIASFMGMNVDLGFFNNNQYAFAIISIISLLGAIILAIVLKKKNML